MSVLPSTVPTVEDVYGVTDYVKYGHEPSYTHKLTETRVFGKVDELEAYKQAVYKILSTERYRYVIYSWDYGVELLDLIGQPVAYVVPEIEARIIEAVMQDDRTLGVDSFEFDTTKFGVVAVTFRCTSIHGNVEITTSVEY